jgi:hypothetical protein
MHAALAAEQQRRPMDRFMQYSLSTSGSGAPALSHLAARQLKQKEDER